MDAVRNFWTLGSAAAGPYVISNGNAKAKKRL